MISVENKMVVICFAWSSFLILVLGFVLNLTLEDRRLFCFFSRFNLHFRGKPCSTREKVKVRLLGKTFKSCKVKNKSYKKQKKNNNQEIRATICKKKKKIQAKEAVLWKREFSLHWQEKD